MAGMPRAPAPPGPSTQERISPSRKGPGSVGFYRNRRYAGRFRQRPIPPSDACIVRFRTNETEQNCSLPELSTLSTEEPALQSDTAAVFEHARRMGLEGIVSKRLDKPYRSGRSGDWIKTKNPDSPAMQRAREGRW